MDLLSLDVTIHPLSPANTNCINVSICASRYGKSRNYGFLRSISCPADQYLDTTLGECVDCQSCPLGRYRKNCGGSSAGTCTACSTSCPEGQYLDGCNGTSAGECASYLASCPPGPYLKGCTGRFAGFCATCRAWCPCGQYEYGCGVILNGTCSVSFLHLSKCLNSIFCTAC